jgi:hypothetical protein
MARLNKELVKQRESEALEAFETGASVKQVNDALFLKHGKKMGLKRIYELKVEATKAVVPQVVESEGVAVE